MTLGEYLLKALPRMFEKRARETNDTGEEEVEICTVVVPKFNCQVIWILK
jgi:hypothetical protein